MSDVKDMQEPMSLKQLFQGIIPETMEIIQGKVISESPLEIQAVNDDKLILGKNLICLPRHLSTYQSKIDIQLGNGTINSVTMDGQGAHPHGTSGEHGGHLDGDGTHGHPDGEGSHIHNVTTFNIYGATMTVYNGLKTGDIVYILSFNHGKKYYILDREA